MTADKGPDDLNALAADEVSQLFGWPVSLLDEIRELRDLAEQGEIWIDEWRRRDALLRASGPGQSPREQIEATRAAALEAGYDRLVGEDDTGDRMLRLAERLGAAMQGAPDDEALREQLERIDDILGTEPHRGLKARFQEKRERVTRWLLSSTQIDDLTGLSWDYLGRYRWLPDPLFGKVPAYAGVARRRALAEAPDEVAHLAKQLRPDAMKFPAVDELDQLALTRFPSLIIEAAAKGNTDAAAVSSQVLQLWQAPETQRLLLRETARGWPENLRQPDPL
jgi:hypothetical protein